MISLNLNAVREKQTESDRIATAMAEFWAQPGGTLKELPPTRMEPKPARRDWVDPETVLIRKRRRLRPVEAAAVRRTTEEI